MADFGELVAELRHREAWAREDVEALVSAARKNLDGAGIHKTQLDALEVLMHERSAVIREAIDGIVVAATPAARGRAVVRALQEIAARAELWQVFRGAFGLRSDPGLGAALDVADLVVGVAYRRLTGALRAWGALAGERPAPLVVLRAQPGQAAAAARREFKLLEGAGYVLQRVRDLPLPIPIVLLPADHLGCLWRLTTLFHELGHVLDGEVVDPRRPGSTLSRELSERSVTALPAEFGEGAAVRAWCAEILADVIGVALGGASYVRVVGLDLLVELARDVELRPEVDPHPHPFVRIPLLLALGAALGAVAAADCARLVAAYEAHPAPAWLGRFEPHLASIAGFFARTPLEALGGHALAELARPWEADAGVLRGLEGYFAGERPVAPWDLGYRVTHDHLPIVAERLRERHHADAAVWPSIHDKSCRAAVYLKRPPQLSAAGVADPREHWRALARALRFAEG